MPAPEQPTAWCGALRRVAEAHGDDAAVAVAEAYGGTTVYVPARRILDEHPLVLRLGREIAETLQRSTAGEQVYIPTSRALRCRTLHRQGRPVREIAGLLGITQRSVRRLLRHLSPEHPR